KSCFLRLQASRPPRRQRKLSRNLRPRNLPRLLRRPKQQQKLLPKKLRPKRPSRNLPRRRAPRARKAAVRLRKRSATRKKAPVLKNLPTNEVFLWQLRKQQPRSRQRRSLRLRRQQRSRQPRRQQRRLRRRRQQRRPQRRSSSQYKASKKARLAAGLFCVWKLKFEGAKPQVPPLRFAPDDNSIEEDRGSHQNSCGNGRIVVPTGAKRSGRTCGSFSDRSAFFLVAVQRG